MTVREIAKLAGVSASAVSIVLNNKKGVSEGTRDRIRRVMEENEYVQTSRTGAKKSRMLICIKYLREGILVEENEGFISSIVESMNSHCHKYGYTLVQMIVRGKLDEALGKIDFSIYSGAFVIATELQRESYHELGVIPIPLVVLDNRMPGMNYSCVGISNSDNVYIALKFCRECGYDEISIIKSTYFSENFADREEAFYRYAKEFGMKVRDELCVSLFPSMAGAYRDMSSFLSRNPGIEMPKCLFADNDVLAIGAIDALKEHGYKIPDDIAVIGIDDVPYAAIGDTSLSTIRIQRKTIGRQAVRNLLHLIDDPASSHAKTSYVGELIVRNSMKRNNE